MNDSNHRARLAETRALWDRPACHLESAKRLTLDFPDSARVWFELGVARAGLADYEAARRAFARSIRLCAPERVHFPMRELGQLYHDWGKPRLADKWFNKALEVEPANPETWAFYGSCLARQGRYAAAKTAWRKMIALGTGETSEGHLNLGFLLRAEERYAEALEHAEEALRLDTEYAEALALKHDLEEVLGRGP